MIRYILFIILSFYTILNAQEVPISSFESYFLKTNNYPNDNTNIWMGNGFEVQGVTNDGDNWYFTVTKKDRSDAYLWRIPKEHDLASVQLSDEGVDFVRLQNIPLDNRFWHWGDLDHYNYEGIDYLLVPIPGIIACFRADDLEYINYANLGTFQDYAGWCAIGIDGKLYSSDNYADDIKQYNIDWNSLVNTSNHNILTCIKEFELDFLGNEYNELRHMQGGEFSDSGELLYIVSGSAGCDIVIAQIKEGPEPSDGIHVFETVGSKWTEVSRSKNSGDFNSFFSYTFDNNCTCWRPAPFPYPPFCCILVPYGSQTPEGLTIWDLEDGSSPNIRGGLHVLVDHYNIAFCDDAVTFQHFSNHIYVDSENGALPPFSPRTGIINRPYKGFNDAFFTYPVWSGAEIILKQGAYDDVGIYNQRVLIKSRLGAAIIGQQ